jgi:hypothetical protein
MVIDVSWSGGLVVGIVHIDDAVIEDEEGKYAFCSAIIIHLGFIDIALLMID